MSAIYQSVGAVVFWCVAIGLTLLAVGTGALLWRDRARIRWPWQRTPREYALLFMLNECREYLEGKPGTNGGEPEAQRLVRRINEVVGKTAGGTNNEGAK